VPRLTVLVPAAGAHRRERAAVREERQPEPTERGRDAVAEPAVAVQQRRSRTLHGDVLAVADEHGHLGAVRRVDEPLFDDEVVRN
jgi:hypothetical protein